MKIGFQALGDEAILINFENKIDLSINIEVHQLAKQIEQNNLEEIRYITPAYNSILIVFDKSIISYSSLLKKLDKHEEALGSLNPKPTRKLYIPVCYDRAFSLDLDEVVFQTKLSAAEIVKQHTSQVFATYMMGFLPGFPYLGKLPKSLECVRKTNPRLKLPKGAVGLAGLQTGIYPIESPGGWQIIGNTPLNLIGEDLKNPFLFEAGDLVSFYSISKSKYKSIVEDQNNGNFNWENVYEKAN